MLLRGQEVNEEQRATVPPLRTWRQLLQLLYLWACERLYDELAWWYDGVSWLVSAGHWRCWQAAVWNEVRGHSVLEMGFGTGELIKQGMARGFSMVGIDRSAAMQAVAR